MTSLISTSWKRQTLFVFHNTHTHIYIYIYKYIYIYIYDQYNVMSLYKVFVSYFAQVVQHDSKPNIFRGLVVWRIVMQMWTIKHWYFGTSVELRLSALIETVDYFIFRYSIIAFFRRGSTIHPLSFRWNYCSVVSQRLSSVWCSIFPNSVISCLVIATLYLVVWSLVFKNKNSTYVSIWWQQCI